MVLKLQTQIAADSVLERDPFVLTPHFAVLAGASDAQALCDDWADAVTTLAGGTGPRQVIVRAYDAQGTPPVYPIGETIRNLGLAPASGFPREVALCLSFYAERNVPRRRGRLYCPAPLMTTAAGVRPTQNQIDGVMAFGPALGDLGGADVDWVVYSRTDGVARPVTNYWCDNEWDTVRSRGLRATTRSLGTTTEA